MAVTTPTRPKNERLREDYHWTPRQREVLAMLVKGYTNGRIAEALGISLDGAKWHISEIISKLGVDSREEAAEYWRAYNGMSLRFSRLFRAIFTGAAAKVAMGGVGLAVVAGVGVLVAVTLWQRAEDKAADEAPPVTATVEVPTPGASATPDTTAPDVARTLTLNPAVQSVPNTVIYTVTGCFQCDGPDETLQRHVADGTGKLSSTTLLEGNRGVLVGWGIGYITAAPDGSVLAAVVCDADACGGLGPGRPGTRWQVITSQDGGLSWQPSLSATGSYVNVLNASRHGLTVLMVGDNSERSHVAVTPQGRRELPAPIGSGEFSDPTLLSDGRVVWLAGDRSALFDEHGARIQLAPGTVTIAQVQPTASGGLAVLVPNGVRNGRYSVQLQVLDRNLELASAWDADPAYTLGMLTSETALANVTGDTFGLSDPATSYPTLVDFTTGTMKPIAADVFTSQRGRNRFIALQAGRFARVNADGDCLNVRERPDTAAKSLACYKDGVLLKDRGETRQAGGVTWLAVTTPSGQDGWAALEFLER